MNDFQGKEEIKEQPQTHKFNNSPIAIDDGEILADILPFEEAPEANIVGKSLSKILSVDALLDYSLQNNSAQPSETLSASSLAETEELENIVKYSSREGQWSPLNPEGKKQYGREFLLQLQTVPLSMRKPLKLPNLNIIKDKPHIHKLGDIKKSEISSHLKNFRDAFLPTFARRTPKKEPTSPLFQHVKLHEAEDPWKPAFKQTLPLKEEDKFKRSVQAILNKLTPQKFETLLTHLKGLNMDTEEKLIILVDLIFENAVHSRMFSIPFAHLCRHLSMIKVPAKHEEFDNFRKPLLSECQNGFQRSKSDKIIKQLKGISMKLTDPLGEVDTIQLNLGKVMPSRGLGGNEGTETLAGSSDIGKTTLTENRAVKLSKTKKISRKKESITNLVRALQRRETITKTDCKEICNSQKEANEIGSAGVDLIDETMQNKSESEIHELLSHNEKSDPIEKKCL